jgi:argininosuccinate lyase
MDNTGRIRKALLPEIAGIVFEDIEASIQNYLTYSCQVDKAHLIMLLNTNLVKKEPVSKILKIIGELEADEFAALRKAKVSRGAFSLYEDYIMQQVGLRDGGYLQYGRSRNDLNSTVSLLRFRAEFQQTHDQLTNLLTALTNEAFKYQNTLMPAYTHYQPAVPITYGHWLVGLCFNLARLLHDLQSLEKAIQTSPLGACSVGGTTIAINTRITSELLGFDHVFDNSVDAVSSRDWALRYLSIAAIIGTTLSRAANQLLIFSTQEFAFFNLPDEIVGASSLMPNKRNPFVLEHVYGKSASVYGALSAALSATHNTLFSNSISVSQDSLNPVWHASREICDAMVLLSLFVSHAKPNGPNMKNANVTGATFATELANQLVVNENMSFRQAHKKIGSAITELELEPDLVELQNQLHSGNIDLFDMVRRAEYGGGPGQQSMEKQLAEMNSKIQAARSFSDRLRGRWQKAQQHLEKSIGEARL